MSGTPSRLPRFNRTVSHPTPHAAESAVQEEVISAPATPPTEHAKPMKLPAARSTDSPSKLSDAGAGKRAETPTKVADHVLKRSDTPTKLADPLLKRSDTPSKLDVSQKHPQASHEPKIAPSQVDELNHAIVKFTMKNRALEEEIVALKDEISATRAKHDAVDFENAEKQVIYTA